MSELPRVGERLEEQETAPFDEVAVRAYATASGDDNPLHRDPALAAQAGLSAPPVHGMLVAAAFESVVRAWRPDLRIARLQAKFVQPLLTGEAARISGRVMRVDEAGVLMRLIAQGPARAPAVLAEALLVRVETPA